MYVPCILFRDIISNTHHRSAQSTSTQEYPDCTYGHVNILLIEIILQNHTDYILSTTTT